MKIALLGLLLCSPFVLAHELEPQVLQGQGLILDYHGVDVVRKTFSPEEPMKRHNHTGSTVVITIVEGKGILTVNQKDFPIATGDVFSFDGKDFIEGKFSMPTKVVVTLAKQSHRQKDNKSHHHNHDDEMHHHDSH